MITINLLIMVSVLFGSSALCTSESRRLHTDRRNENNPQRQHLLKEPRSLTDAHEVSPSVARRILQTDGRNENKLQSQQLWNEPQLLTDAHKGPTRVARRIAERLQRLDARIRDNDRKPRDTVDRLHQSNEKTRNGKNMHGDGLKRRDSDEKLDHFITVAIILEDLGNRQTADDKRRFKQSRYKRLKVKHDEERKTSNQQETDDIKQEDNAGGTFQGDFEENVDEDRRSDDDGLFDRDENDKADQDLLDEDGNVIERYKKHNNNKEQTVEDYRTLENDKDNADDEQGDYGSYQEIDTNESGDQHLRDEGYIQESDDPNNLDVNEDYDEKEPPGKTDDESNKEEQDDKEIKNNTDCDCGFWKRFGEDVAFSIQENMIALSTTSMYFLILLCFCPIMTKCLCETVADMTFFCCFVFPIIWLNLLLIKPR